MAIKSHFPIYKILGLFILVYILRKIDWKNYLSIFKKWNIYYISLGAGILFIQLFLKVKRWKHLLIINNIHIKENNFKLLKYYLTGLFFSVFTPGKSGDLLKFSFLNTNNKKKAFIVTVYDRIWDIITLLPIGLVSLYYIFGNRINYIIVSIFIFIIFSFLIFRYFKKKFDFIKYINNFFNLNIYDTFLIVILSFLSFFFFYLRVYFIQLGFYLEYNLFQIIIICACVSIITLLPISISGLGTREVVVLYLSGIFNFNNEYALALSSIMLLITLFDGALGYLAWLSIGNQNQHFDSYLSDLQQY